MLFGVTQHANRSHQHQKPEQGALAISRRGALRTAVPRRTTRKLPSSRAALRNRSPSARSAGTVSTVTAIPKYVEPQMTYTSESAVHTFGGARLRRRQREGTGRHGIIIPC